MVEQANRNDIELKAGAARDNADICRPVYEAGGEDSPDKTLVMTPWMLLDGLKELEEQAERLLHLVRAQNLGWERRYGVPVNPLADTAEQLQFGAAHLLRLLWRGGLWTDDEIALMNDAEGETFQVLRAPFTDGKPNGRPLPVDAPRWQRDLLGATSSDCFNARDTVILHFASDKAGTKSAESMNDLLVDAIGNTCATH